MRAAIAAVFLVSIVTSQDVATVIVPAFTGFSHPDPEAMRRSDDGSVRRWKGELSWYGRLARPGELHIEVELSASAPRCELELECAALADGDPAVRRATVPADASRVGFGPLTVVAPGYHRLTLRCTDGGRPGLVRLRLSGPPADGAQFSTVERRNAASVHLGYEVPRAARDSVEWFYCEVTPRTDPLWSYYMATGWSRGYFGMQVNSPTERRVIFSVWDSGNEAVDRSKVADDDRVHLVVKGQDVVADDFGNEGTGGHSHRVVPWRLGDTFRFLVRAQVDGTHTTFTGWFRSSIDEPWQLVASFRAPKDGHLLHGLYSFNENFSGANGDLRRDCEFGNQWIRTTDGAWQALLSARFTHDGHGQSERLDRSGGTRGDRFYLANGGFVDDPDPTAVTTARSVIARGRGKGEPPDLDALGLGTGR